MLNYLFLTEEATYIFTNKLIFRWKKETYQIFYTLLLHREKKNDSRRRWFETSALTFVAPRPYTYAHTELCLHKIAKRAIACAKNSTGLTCRFSLVLTVYRLLSLPPPTGRSRWIHATSLFFCFSLFPSFVFWFSFIRNAQCTIFPPTQAT